MIKSKLVGSVITNGISTVRTPNVIILGEHDDLDDIDVQNGDLVDANSIKNAIARVDIAPKDPAKITKQQISELF
jgi:hypothetical protein